MPNTVFDQSVAAWGSPRVQQHVDAAGIILLMLDKLGRIKFINRNGHEALEYGEGDLLGKNWFDTCLPADERQRLWPMFRHLLASDKPPIERLECRLLTRSGRERIAVWFDRVLTDESGNRMGLFCSGKDITDRKLAEDALRRSEEKFSLVFHASPAPTSVTRWDDGYIVDCNESLLRLFGFRREEFIGASTLKGWVDPRQREHLLRLLAEKGSVRDLECRLLHKDGHQLITQLSAEAIELDGERCILSLFVDITERRRAEEEIQKLALVVRHSSELVSLTDLEGRMIFLNEAGTRLLGISSDDVRQHTFRDVVPPEFLPVLREEILPALTRLGLWEGDMQCVHVQTGERIDARAMSLVIQDPHSGKPLCYAHILRDITHCKRVQEALQESEAKFRAVFESARDAIVLIAEERFLDCNPQTLTMFGLQSKEQLLGLHPCSVSPPSQPDGQDSRQAAREHMRKALLQGHDRFEWLHRRPDGTEFPAEVILSAFELAGKRLLHTTIRDVTERKKSEELLQQAKDAAEAASRSKSEFLANMSHEIRTPLTAIMGYADVLLEHPDPKEVREAAETIKRNGEHLLQVISDILDISKVEVGKLEPELSHCSPRRIVEDVVFLMKVRADGKGLRLIPEFQGAIPETIRTDAVRLRQILINLVGNAIKFTEVGSVRVVAQLVEGSDGQPQMRFDVVDTGIGLAEQHLGMLFQPFSQIDGSMQRKFGGSGLGLAISKRLAQMLGGNITVQSTPGKGSTFHVTIATGPLEGARNGDGLAAPAAGPSPAAGEEIRLACRLLLAEDGPDNQRLLCFVLKKAGADVTVADNGQIAVECALAAQREGKPFDLVLMDMQMPVMDGYEATQRLRQAGFTAPVIALTAHAMADDRQSCLHVGCDDYMSKPIVARELVQLIASRVKEHQGTLAKS